MSTVKEILQNKGNDVYTAPPATKVYDAIETMEDKGIGTLIIFEDQQIKGLFTEGDYIRRVLLQGIDINTTLVDDVMTEDVITISPNQTVNETMQLMVDKDIRYVPVVDESNLLGVISVGDCIRKVISEQEETIEHLEHYINS